MALLGVAVLALCLSNGLAAAEGRASQVLVARAGLVREREGANAAKWALVLRNRSSTRDALDIAVRVSGIDSRGRLLARTWQRVTLIPAGQTFTLVGFLTWGVASELADIRVDLRVGKSAAKARRLPPVTQVVLSNRRSYEVVGLVGNPYGKPLPELMPAIYGVFLDAQGNILATDQGTTTTLIEPGESAPFGLSGSRLPERVGAASVLISVDPCGGVPPTACPFPRA